MKSFKILLGLGLLLATTFANSVAFAADSTFTGEQQTKIESIVHDYILKNPQVLVEAIQKLQDQAHNDMMKQAQQAIDSQATALFANPNSPVIGNAKGTVTLVEFFDYQCPYCKRIALGVNDLVKTNNNLRIVFKELPIFGDTSNFASQAALAAQMQDKYLPFHNALMQAKPPFTNQQVLAIAKSVGINLDKLQTDMKNKSVIEEIKNNVALANQMQLVGTPAFVVANIDSNNKAAKPSKSIFVPGAVGVDKLQQIIKQLS